MTATPKTGPALTLVTAVLTDDVGLVFDAADLAADQPVTETGGQVSDESMQGLANSCTELIRRMLLRTELHVYDEDLAALAGYVTNVRYVWPDIYVRGHDRLNPWSPARRYGIRIAQEMMRFYILNAGLLDGDGEPVTPPRITLRVPPRAIKRPREFTLGLAYATALIVSAIADYDRRPVRDRLDAYRAAAARELLAESAA